MALTEFPSNSRRKRGWTVVRDEPESPTDSILRAYEDRSDVMSTRGSLQGMMRKSTETGNIGQFSILPTHGPPRVSPRESSLRYNGDELPQHQLDRLVEHERARPYRTTYDRHASLVSERETTVSSVISMYKSGSQKSPPPQPPYMHPEDGRAYSLCQSPPALLTCRSDGNLRPRSPFAYPTRLKRPGYRPSSPALTDFGGSYSRTYVGFGRQRSGSNASSYYVSGSNRSAPILRSYPAAQINNMHGRPMRTTSAHLPYRQPTSRPQSNQTVRTQARRHASQGDFWRAPPLPVHSPEYYDYSENIVRREAQQQDGLEQSSPASRNSKSPEAQSEKYRPAEDRECARPAMQISPTVDKSTARVLRSPLPITSPLAFQRQMLEWEREKTADDRSEKNALSGIDHTTSESVGAMEAASTEPSLETTIGHHILSSSKKRFSFSSPEHEPASLSGVHGEETSTDVSRLVDTFTTSSVKDKHETKSDVKEDETLAPAWRIPSLHFESLKLETKGKNACHVQIDTATTCHHNSSHRGTDKLSRMFSLSESLAELAHVALNTSSEGRLGRMDKQDHPPSQQVISDVYSVRPLDAHNSVSNGPGPSLDYAAEVMMDYNQRDQARSPPDTDNEAGKMNIPRPDSDTCPWSPNESCLSLLGQAGSQATDGESSKTYGKPTADMATVPERLGKWMAVESRVKLARTWPTSSVREIDEPQPCMNGCSDSKFANPRSEESPVGGSDKSLACDCDPPSVNTASRPLEPGQPETPTAPAKPKAEGQPEGAFIASPPQLQSWKFDERYNWSDVAESAEDSAQKSDYSKGDGPRLPEFRLEITRATNSTSNTHISSPTPSPLARRANASMDSTRSADSAARCPPGHRKGYSLIPVSSAHFAEHHLSRPPSVPRISLRPPSPFLYGSRGLFPDDSSRHEQQQQQQQQGKTRKVRNHFPHAKARTTTTTTRAASADDMRGRKGDPAEGNRNVTGTDGRRASAEGMSAMSYARWKIKKGLRRLWRRGEERLRGLGDRIRTRARARSDDSELYDGV